MMATPLVCVCAHACGCNRCSPVFTFEVVWSQSLWFCSTGVIFKLYLYNSVVNLKLWVWFYRSFCHVLSTKCSNFIVTGNSCQKWSWYIFLGRYRPLLLARLTYWLTDPPTYFSLRLVEEFWSRVLWSRLGVCDPAVGLRLGAVHQEDDCPWLGLWLLQGGASVLFYRHNDH